MGNDIYVSLNTSMDNVTGAYATAGENAYFTLDCALSSDLTAFTTHSPPYSPPAAAAPEPMSMILFGTGAISLAVRRFWKKKKL